MPYGVIVNVKRSCGCEKSRYFIKIKELWKGDEHDGTFDSIYNSSFKKGELIKFIYHKTHFIWGNDMKSVSKIRKERYWK